MTLPLSSLSPRQASTRSPAALLAGGTTGAGLEVFAEVINAQHKTSDRLCNRLEDVHHRLAGGGIILIAGPSIAGTGRDRVDDDQAQRQPEFFLQGSIRLPRHGDQRLDRALVQQHRRGLVPSERRPLHVAAFGADHCVQAQPHFVGTFGGDQQHAALALHGMTQERLAGPQCGRKIEHDERLAGAPLAAQQPVAARRDQMLDQPALERPRIGIAVCKQRRQIRILLRRLVVELVSSRSSSSSSSVVARDLIGSSSGGSGSAAAAPLLPSRRPAIAKQRQPAGTYLLALLAISLLSRPSLR